MKALISPSEKVYLPDGSVGERVADVHVEGFSVAEPLYWLSCADDVVADQFYYNGTEILLVPQEQA